MEKRDVHHSFGSVHEVNPRLRPDFIQPLLNLPQCFRVVWLVSLAFGVPFVVPVEPP